MRYETDCPDCGGTGTMPFMSSDGPDMDGCRTCKGSGKVGLAVECEKCEGSGKESMWAGSLRFSQTIADNTCTCHNGKRFLTVEEVEEFKMEKRGIPFSEVIRCVMLDGSTVTYKGKPVTVEAI